MSQYCVEMYLEFRICELRPSCTNRARIPSVLVCFHGRILFSLAHKKNIQASCLWPSLIALFFVLMFQLPHSFTQYNHQKCKKNPRDKRGKVYKGFEQYYAHLQEDKLYHHSLWYRHSLFRRTHPPTNTYVTL